MLDQSTGLSLLRGCRPLLYAGLAILFCGALGGCRYSLSGIVLTGKSPGVFVVNKDDPRLQNIGVDLVRVQVSIDPKSVRPKALPLSGSDELGRFSIPVDVSGAGFLEYEAYILCRKAGYQPVETIIPLPPKNKRVLIIMSRGRDIHQGGIPGREVDRLRREAEQLGR